MADDLPAAAVAQRSKESVSYLADLLLIAGEHAQRTGALLREAGALMLKHGVDE